MVVEVDGEGVSTFDEYRRRAHNQERFVVTARRPEWALPPRRTITFSLQLLAASNDPSCGPHVVAATRRAAGVSARDAELCSFNADGATECGRLSCTVELPGIVECISHDV